MLHVENSTDFTPTSSIPPGATEKPTGVEEQRQSGLAVALMREAAPVLSRPVRQLKPGKCSLVYTLPRIWERFGLSAHVLAVGFGREPAYDNNGNLVQGAAGQRAVFAVEAGDNLTLAKTLDEDVLERKLLPAMAMEISDALRHA